MVKPPEPTSRHNSKKYLILLPSEPFTLDRYTMRHPVDEFANSENIEFHYMSRHERVWLTTATRAQCLTLVKRGCVSQFL